MRTLIRLEEIMSKLCELSIEGKPAKITVQAFEYSQFCSSSYQIGITCNKESPERRCNVLWRRGADVYDNKDMEE